MQPQKHVEHAPVGIWDIKTGKQILSLPGRGARCRGLAFSEDSKRLLLSSIVPSSVSNKSISCKSDAKVVAAAIDIGTQTILGELTMGDSQVVALCPDGETIALTATDFQSIRLHHLPSRTDRGTIKAKSSRFAFSPDAKSLVTIDEEGQSSLWDTKKGEKIRDLDGHMVTKDIDVMTISKDGKTVAARDGGWTSAVRLVVWNATTGQRAERPEGHEATVTCLAYSPDGKMLVSGSIDRTVRLWNPATAKQIRVLTHHKSAIRSLTYSLDGKLVASSSVAGVTRVCNTDGKTLVEFAGPEKGATTLSFSHDNKVLFWGGESSEIVGHEIVGGKEVTRLKTGVDGLIMSLGTGATLALTANGEIRDETAQARVQIWNVLEKRFSVSLPIGETKRIFDSVHCQTAILSPTGRFVATSQVSTFQGIRPSYGDTKLRLWESSTGEEFRLLSPTITKLLAFSPNGRLLASGGAGQSGHLQVGYGAGVDVWDTLTGRKIDSLSVTPECVAFSPDGAFIATGGRDHCVTISQTPKAQPQVKVPTDKEREQWWAALGGEGKAAYQAIGEMADVPEHAVALLKLRVLPIKPSDPQTAAKLIAQLGSEEFAERQQADQALEKMGEAVAHHLLKAAQDENLELRRRIQRLLKKCNEVTTASKQVERSIVALEMIGTTEARAVLRGLADGAPGARRTIANAALQRVGR